MNTAYNGDVTVADCFSVVSSGQDAFLIDVRTAAEWTYVGFPLLPGGRRVLFQEWQMFPSMAVDPSFTETLSARLREAGGSEGSHLYFLCRSGVRSMASAAAMTEAGFAACFNVLDGFEGPPDEEGHRGVKAGWKAEGLPWGQR